MYAELIFKKLNQLQFLQAGELSFWRVGSCLGRRMIIQNCIFSAKKLFYAAIDRVLALQLHDFAEGAANRNQDFLNGVFIHPVKGSGVDISHL